MVIKCLSVVRLKAHCRETDHENSCIHSNTIFIWFSGSAQKTVVYHLNVEDAVVNYTGKSKHAIAINGTIPAPTLYFTEVDTAEIYVHNSMREEPIKVHHNQNIFNFRAI